MEGRWKAGTVEALESDVLPRRRLPTRGGYPPPFTERRHPSAHNHFCPFFFLYYNPVCIAL